MSKLSPAMSDAGIEASALSRFFSSFSQSQQKIEESLMMLELAAEDAVINDLQQAIQDIEQALSALGLDKLTLLTSSVNTIVVAVKNHQIEFETLLSDLILLVINDIQTIIERMIDNEKRCVIVDRLPKICSSIERIQRVDKSDRQGAIKDALLLLDPTMEIIESRVSHNDTLQNLFSQNDPDTEELISFGVEESEDFIFFKTLSRPLEERARYWKGRSARMLRLALQMNDHAGRPVDPEQLAAAVYMHDAGMALLPLEVINSREALSEDELSQVKQHPVISYELMRYMKSWREAAAIVLQHHEQVNGHGYPHGLKENEICEGAKILAIVDAVDARTHERAHAMLLKRPLLRAAIELGKYSGTQFSEKWVNVFKEIFQEVRQVKND